MVRKILSIVAWVLTGAALVALFIAAREDYLGTPVKSYNVSLDPESANGFVKESAVLSELGAIGEGAKIGTVNMDAICKQLKANPWIESTSSYVDLDGTLNVSIKEHKPAFRVFGTNGQSAYITSEGVLLPTSDSHTPHLLIASGNFSFDPALPHCLADSVEADRNLICAMSIDKAIGRNDFIKSCIGQVYCNAANEFELVVTGIDARIIVGDTCQIDDKLKRLEVFVKSKAGSSELRNFKTINLKYRNQIVCTKR